MDKNVKLEKVVTVVAVIIIIVLLLSLISISRNTKKIAKEMKKFNDNFEAKANNFQNALLMAIGTIRNGDNYT